MTDDQCNMGPSWFLPALMDDDIDVGVMLEARGLLAWLYWSLCPLRVSVLKSQSHAEACVLLFLPTFNSDRV